MLEDDLEIFLTAVIEERKNERSSSQPHVSHAESFSIQYYVGFILHDSKRVQAYLEIEP